MSRQSVAWEDAETGSPEMLVGTSAQTTRCTTLEVASISVYPQREKKEIESDRATQKLRPLKSPLAFS